jgi:hypothetical protein
VRSLDILGPKLSIRAAVKLISGDRRPLSATGTLEGPLPTAKKTWYWDSPKPEFFVFIPRGDRGWDPHASYHLDGTLHQKSFDQKSVSQKRQPLTGAFRGTAHLGAYMGHDPKGVGAICDLTAFSGVVEVATKTVTGHQIVSEKVPSADR